MYTYFSKPKIWNKSFLVYDKWNQASNKAEYLSISITELIAEGNALKSSFFLRNSSIHVATATVQAKSMQVFSLNEMRKSPR